MNSISFQDQLPDPDFQSPHNPVMLPADADGSDGNRLSRQDSRPPSGSKRREAKQDRSGTATPGGEAAAQHGEVDGRASDQPGNGDAGQDQENGPETVQLKTTGDVTNAEKQLVQEAQPSVLLPQHIKLLRNSGITEAIQHARGYTSVESAPDLRKLGFPWQQCLTPSLVIPVWNLDGQVILHHIRPDQPRIVNGKVVKYEIPKGQQYVIDVPPLAQKGVLDQEKRMFITVGVGKADSLVSQGECAIALLGPTGWKEQDNFWNRIPLDNRLVVVVLDSNTTTDKAAIMAAAGLKDFLESRKAQVRLIVLPSDSTGGKVGVDDYLAAGRTVDDLLGLQPLELPDQDRRHGGESAYRFMPDGMYRVIPGKKEENLQRLTNFPAKIISELIVTDGMDETREFEIEATVGGQTKLITIAATEFESMAWVLKKLGAEAVVQPGYGIRDHARAAIQHVSGQIRKVMVYEHTGWVRHNGHDVFLHAGGAIGRNGEISLAGGDPAGVAAADVPQAADHVDSQDLVNVDAPRPENVSDIGANGETEAASGAEASRRADLRVTRAEVDEHRPASKPCADQDLRASGTIGTIGKRHTQSFGINVRLPSALQGYRLPPPTTGEELNRAVRASLEFLETVPDPISIPLYASIWRALAGNVNFSLQLVGTTQCGKTVLAALAQQHFGPDMNADNLPAAWFSTGNSIVAMAYLAKDVLLTVDDLLFEGSRGDADQTHRKTETVLRSQGNRAGRARCRGDGSLIEGKAPRGLILSTGEDTPDGPSLNSRGLILPLGRRDVNWDKVTICQGHASNGLFAMAMAGFVQWMAKDYQNFVHATQEQIEVLHQMFLSDPMPSRTARIAASLLAGLENFLEFAQECGAIDQAEFDNLWDRAHKALRAAAQSHKDDQDSSHPVQRFGDLLAEAFHSGRAYVANSVNEAPEISPEDWGWEKQIIVVPVDNERSVAGVAAEQEATIHKGVDETQEGVETKEVTKYRHRGSQVGWWDSNDNLFLLPDVALAVVQQLAQTGGRPLPITSRTLGKLLDANGKLKSKRKGRYTKQITREAAQVNVLHVDAAWINPLFPDPLTEEEQEEQRKLYGALLADA
jgi:hypothetical protein